MAGHVADGATRPVIGVMPKYVTGDRIPTCVSAADSLIAADNYLQAVIAAGGAPFVLPLTDDAQVYETLLPLLDGLLLTGGADVDPRMYGGDAHHEKLGVVVPRRDAVERVVIAYAYEHDMPLLGVCRGMQALNVFFGGTLYEDLEEQRGGAQAAEGALHHWQDIGYDKASHEVTCVDGSRLQRVVATDTLRTNSMHHQGVRRLAPALNVMAHASDGLVEAIEVPGRSFMMGVQWHPEFLSGQESSARIFSALVEESAAYRVRKEAVRP